MTPPDQKLRLLLVEDEAMIAMMIADMVEATGYEVWSVASDEQQALDAATTGSFEMAILDVNLGGKLSYAVADALVERGIPFLFVTGYGKRGLESKFAHIPTLQKPFVENDLEKALSAAWSRAGELKKS